MPTSLPVPSKGALKALRTLALGTSCTVAVGAGLLTEDRRRRIHTARQVYDNAQTLKSLKSSRNYHGAGAIESFEEQALRHSDDAFWLPSNVAKSKIHASPAPRVDGGHLREEFIPESPKTPNSAAPIPQMKPIKKTLSRLSSNIPLTVVKPINFVEATISTKSQDLVDPNSTPWAEIQGGNRYHEHRLALDIEALLDGTDQAPDVDTATLKFLGAFEERVKATGEGMHPILVEAAIKLVQALPKQFDVHERILRVVSRHGPMDEAQFEKFGSTHLMNRIMKRVKEESSGRQYVDVELLKTVASIYLTPFTAKPSIATDRKQGLGERLCAATCQAGLYDLTSLLFTRLELQRGGRPVHCVEHLIEAVHASKQPREIFRYFKSLYPQTSPDQVGFFKIGNMVMDMLLKEDISTDFEEFLDVASQIAVSNEIQTSTTWFLKVLGHDWRTNQDISRTRSLFERMVPLISSTAHPQAVYGAIIQFCVEAGVESAAMDYYTRLSEIYPGASTDMRILGHLAYAKALRGDWDGVRADLKRIHELNLARSVSQQNEFSAIFTPILKKFVQSHHITRTEEFIRTAIYEWNLKITPFISNTMVGVYSASKEIDPMIRWIELAASVGCKFEAATVNTLFRKFTRDWNFSFLEVNHLYHQIRKLDKAMGTNSTNAETVLLLEKIAMSKSRNDDGSQKNLCRLRNISKSQPDSSGIVSGPRKLYHDMGRAYFDGRLEDVLQLYRDSQAGPMKLGPKPLLLAVKATLKSSGGSIEEAAALVKQAQDNGENISESVANLMVHRIASLDERKADAQAISDMTRDDIRALEGRGIEVPDTVLTHAMSVLVRRQRFRSAVDVWQSTSQYFNRNPSVADLVTLTVLLEAYIGMRFNNGITWVIKMLSENKLAPDSKFYSVLINARRQLRKDARNDVGSKATNHMACIEKVCDQVGEMRLALKEEKGRAKRKFITLVEMVAEDQEASLSAKLIGGENDPSFRSKETELEIGGGSVGRWSDPEELELDNRLPSRNAVASCG